MKNQRLSGIGDITGFSQSANSVVFRCAKGLVRLSVVNERVIRVEAVSGDSFPVKRSFVVLESVKPSETAFGVAEDSKGWLLTTSALRVHVTRSPCSLTFRDLQGRVLSEDASDIVVKGEGDELRCIKVLPKNEHYYGFGHKGGRLDKRGTRMVMWNQYQAYTPDSDPLSINVPFFVAIRAGIAFGVYLDSPAKSVFDMGAKNRKQYSFTCSDPHLDYYFIYGPDPKQVLYSYSRLTGTMPLPPRWVLGYHQSRYSYPTERRVREIARELRTRQIPCDVIWFDIHYMDGYRLFTWDKKAFRNPEKLIANLRAAGFHSVVIIDPGVKQEEAYSVYKSGVAKDCFLRKVDGSLFVGTVWPGSAVFPNFLSPAVRLWWGDLHTPLLDQGVAAIWNDLNEPQVFLYAEYDELAKTVHFDGERTYPDAYMHNLYANLENQATFEALLRRRPNQRPWILSRAGWAGVQRYAAVWTADCASTWEYLRVTVPMLLNLGMSGMPFVGSDIGGFFKDCTSELFTRWLEMAVFTPFCRDHTCDGTADQEPWAFGPEVEAISRRFINRRYQLLPYLYDLVYEAAVTGTPIVRPLVLEFPNDERCSATDDEFLLGGSLLIAPILRESAKEREVYLPAGKWIDQRTLQAYKGPSTIRVPAALGECPTFARVGSIIPLQPVVQHTGEPIKQLQLAVFPPTVAGDAVEYRHYEDDGETLGYKQGDVAFTQYWCHAEPGEIAFSILPREGSYNPGKRNYRLSIHAIEEKPHRVLLDERVLTRLRDVRRLDSVSTGWFWQRQNRTLQIQFPDNGNRLDLRIMCSREAEDQKRH
jgi:alpha-glucosidase